MPHVAPDQGLLCLLRSDCPNMASCLVANLFISVLFYVQKRKKRKALGWTMDADDVIACIMPDEDPELSGLEVDIYGGRFFKAKLTKKERATLKQSVSKIKVFHK